MSRNIDEIDKLFLTYFQENQDIPLVIENGIRNSFLQNKKHRQLAILIPKIIATIIAVLAITGGVVFASISIYNSYIKEQKALENNALFQNEENISSYDYNLLQIDMTYNSELRLYYKAIKNLEDYKSYQERISEFPEMTEKSFKDNFLFIITWDIAREPHEHDLEIEKVENDNKNTIITLKQKETPDYTTNNNILYAIIEKKYLKENIILKMHNKELSYNNFININFISKDYNIENAKKDGCIALKNNELKSNNINLLENFISSTEKGESSFIRIYSEDIEKHIIDIEFSEGIYYVYDYNLSIQDKDKVRIIHSYRKMKKSETEDSTIYFWIEAEKDNSFIGKPFINIKK